MAAQVAECASFPRMRTSGQYPDPARFTLICQGVPATMGSGPQLASIRSGQPWAQVSADTPLCARSPIGSRLYIRLARAGQFRPTTELARYELPGFSRISRATSRSLSERTIKLNPGPPVRGGTQDPHANRPDCLGTGDDGDTADDCPVLARDRSVMRH